MKASPQAGGSASATPRRRRGIRSGIHRREEQEVDLKRTPPSPEEDVLLFIRDHNPFLTNWERDLLTIVHEEAQYFIPQIETKIMNEGWASFWHKRTSSIPSTCHRTCISSSWSATAR